MYLRDGTTWSQQSYHKASNTTNSYRFGDAVALSEAMAAVGSYGEASSATGVNGNQTDTTAPWSGAAYVIRSSYGYRRYASRRSV